MVQPKGFEDTTHHEYVCKLNKSIIGLKQAAKGLVSSVFLKHYWSWDCRASM
jgi:hypothetical protein